ncbi:MAG: hypothetical protein HY996_02510 [Micrococcales bacterium]|nr:hypothetical protein [Micrococcales bacterium]
MKRILYASGSFLTETGIAEALLEYAATLAIVGSSDVVVCQGIDDAGVSRRIQMLIGPSSQILAIETDEGSGALADVEETIAELKRRTRQRLPDSTDIGDTGPDAPAESDAQSASHESY